MKKLVLLAAVVLAVLFVLCILPVSAQNDIIVLLNDQEIEFDVPPQLINDRTMVPVRAIFEALGAEVEWDEATQTVCSKKGETTVELTINQSKMLVNDSVVELDSPACIVNDRTLVPVRAISEAYDCTVDWDEETYTVIIRSGLYYPQTTFPDFGAHTGIAGEMGQDEQGKFYTYLVSDEQSDAITSYMFALGMVCDIPKPAKKTEDGDLELVYVKDGVHYKMVISQSAPANTTVVTIYLNVTPEIDNYNNSIVPDFTSVTGVLAQQMAETPQNSTYRYLATEQQLAMYIVTLLDEGFTTYEQTTDLTHDAVTGKLFKGSYFVDVAYKAAGDKLDLVIVCYNAMTQDLANKALPCYPNTQIPEFGSVVADAVLLEQSKLKTGEPLYVYQTVGNAAAMHAELIKRGAVYYDEHTTLGEVQETIFLMGDTCVFINECPAAQQVWIMWGKDSGIDPETNSRTYIPEYYEFYPDTNVPTFTCITDMPLKETEEDDGAVGYLYDLREGFGVHDYTAALHFSGYILLFGDDEQTETVIEHVYFDGNDRLVGIYEDLENKNTLVLTFSIEE